MLLMIGLIGGVITAAVALVATFAMFAVQGPLFKAGAALGILGFGVAVFGAFIAQSELVTLCGVPIAAAAMLLLHLHEKRNP